MKTRIYTRVFCVFMAIFLLLMGLFTVFYVKDKKEYEISDFLNKVQLDFSNDESFYDDYVKYLDGERGMTAEGLSRLHLSASMLCYAFAIYDPELELIWDSSGKYFCTYFVPVDDESASGERGIMELEKYFSEEDAEEIKGYLGYCDEEADIGEIRQYSVNIKGLWTDGLVVIPEALEIMVDRVTKSKMSEDGGETWVDSTGLNGHYLKEIKALETEVSDLSYYNEGYIFNNDYLMGYDNEHNANDELKKMYGYVTNKEIAKMAIEALISNTHFYQDSISNRCYLMKEGPLAYTCVYAHSIVDDSSEEGTNAWIIYAHSIDIWELYGKELLLIILGCLVVFIAAAWITASQSYRIYLARVKNEENRIKITNALAHDLKTPLAAISGYSDILEEDLNSEKRDHYFGMIKENVEIMDGALRQMLELSKVESFNVKLNKTEFELAELTEEVMKRFEVNSLLKGVKVEIEGDQLMTADRAMIKSAVDNLISNAVKHSEENGKVEVKITDKIWSVYNKGINIPEEEMGKIWEAYCKSDDARSGSEGTGLGLYIVKTIMDIHGLGYRAENKADGVVFSFDIKK
ncbi:MAG: HAMP domain-containing histidine kinase [Firmicutes bacterium]|nr:HAMP domain-containing histidine kinase [Bacillota bacterium]